MWIFVAFVARQVCVHFCCFIVPGGERASDGSERGLCDESVAESGWGISKEPIYVSGDNLETERSVAVRARRENEPARSSDRRRDERDGKGLLYSSSSLGCNCVPCVCPVGDLDKTTLRDETNSSLSVATRSAHPPPLSIRRTVARWAAAPHSHTPISISTLARARITPRDTKKPVSIHCLLALAHSLSGRLL